ncbi:MAG: protein kinase, partial [Chlorobium sp.]|nr:protein kinase [Chlorobium sp.]
ENRYKVEEVMSGAMGYVYIGRDARQQITFAIKQPKESMLADRDLFSRVLHEADSWTGLGMHPNIAYCYFVKQIEDVPHIFIEYVDGGSLEEWISDRRCADYKVGIDMAIQFCHGLERAHERGMIHRDIKPRNILVTKEGLVKVTDFGIAGGIKVGRKAGAISGDQQGTRMGAMMGTQAYMSPEQFKDPRQKSAEAPEGVWYESDVYSFGVCLWEMFCGRRPREISIGVTGDTPDPNSLRRDIPAGLRTLLLSSVELDRGNRPQDFSELREKLNGIYRYLYSSDAPHYQLELHDTTADELNNQGYSYYELGKKEEARRCFEDAVKVNNTNPHPEALFNLLLLQWRAGEIDDMEVLNRIWNRLANPAVSKEKIAELLAFIHAERYDLESAKEELKEYAGKYEELFGLSMSGSIGWIRTFEGHSKRVNSVSLSADGRYALSGGYDETLKLWDVSTGLCLRTFEGHSGSVNSVSLNVDGKYALSGSNDGTIRLWEMSTGQCLRTFEGHRYGFASVSLSADGRYALSGSSDKTLKLWDVLTGQCMHTFVGHSESVKSVCLSADGRYALSGSDDKTLKLWEVSTGKCLRTFEGHSGWVSSGSLSADGKYVLSGSFDATLKLWDVSTGLCLRTFEGSQQVYSACLIAEGRYAISGSWNTLKLWEVSTGQCRRILLGHSKGGNSVSLSADGKYALSGSNETLELWNINIKAHSYKSELQVSDFKAFEEIKGKQDELRLSIEEAERLMNNGNKAKAFATLYRTWEREDFKDNKELLMVYQKLYELSSRKSISFAYQANSFEGHRYGVASVSLSADGSYAISGSYDHTLKLWDMSTGQCLRTFVGHSDSVNSVSLSADGKYAISAVGSMLELWEVATGQSIRSFDGLNGWVPDTIGDGGEFVSPRIAVYSVCLSADGRYALSGGTDDMLKLWEVSTGQCLRTFEGHSNGVRSVSFSADGSYALSGGGDNMLKLWEVSTGQCLDTMEEHNGSVNSVSFSADGKYVLSGSDDKTLKLWDVSTGWCFRTFKGHSERVTSVCLSADGKYAISGSLDKTVKLWNLSTGQCLYTFVGGHSGWVHSVCLSADGKYAISGGHNGTINLWRLIWKLEFD